MSLIEQSEEEAVVIDYEALEKYLSSNFGSLADFASKSKIKANTVYVAFGQKRQPSWLLAIWAIYQSSIKKEIKK